MDKQKPVDQKSKRAVVQAIAAVGEAIRELGSVPSGHLYANLSDMMSLNTYNGIIGALVAAKYVKLSGHELTWIGEVKTCE